jgi:uncharacterized RDD family membrane protein YckC
MIEMNYSEGAQEPFPKEELPQWRKELSQRLQAIKQKRETAQVSGIQVESKAPSLSAPQARAAEPTAASAAKFPKIPLYKPIPKPPVPAPRQKVLRPLEPHPVAAKPALKPTDPQEIRNLIDNAVSRQSAATSAPAPVAEIPSPAPEPFEEDEGKLILLSRTLSGLVDLIFVMLCTGGFILAADFFSGIIALDSISYLDFLVLFLLTYFVYSIFFLATSSQTIGMMITNLRVVGVDQKRPLLRQLLGRCCGYLVSLSGLGIGLLWSLFNRESLCFHDRLSGTHVIRM